MLLRGDQCVFQAAFYGVTSALLLSTSSFVAAAADRPTAAVPASESSSNSSATPVATATTLPAGITVSGNTMMMTPIPDKAPAPVAAPIAVPAGSIADTISLSERPAIIIRNGTITMESVADGQPKARATKAVAARAVAARRDKPAARGSSATKAVAARAVAARRGKAAARGSSEQNCLARAIYFEARGESTRGQEAVAQVVLARKRTPGRPKTICGVVYEGSHRSTGCQFSFTCDGIADTINNSTAWSRAQGIAARAMRGKLKPVARGATFYHANYVRPYWASSMVKVATIGTHIFYRP
jgi:spore germination cell wall hydrolase CwlJ-like protein